MILAWLSILTAVLADRGIPLYFASFEDVGISKIEPQVQSLDVVDQQITDWLEGCHADGYILIRDSGPFDATSLVSLTQISENSMTRGSFLTNYMLNLGELAEDLQRHCRAQRLEADFDSRVPVPPVHDKNPRVIYIEFDHNQKVDKEKIIKSALQAIPSPYVTVVYTSTYSLDYPILSYVELNPQRQKWTGYRKTPLHPIVAPLYSKPRNSWDPLKEPKFDIPDHFLLTVVSASTVFVVLMLFKNALM